MRSINKGFTLIEVLVVITVIGFITGVLIRNFSVRRIYLREMANVMVADVRAAQQKAIAGATYQGQLRCGYGLERTSTTTYRIYAGPQPSASNSFCTSYDRNFTSSGGSADSEMEAKKIIYPVMEFKNTFDDIFFEPPHLKTYIDDDASFGNSPSRITIGRVGQACSSTTCKSVCVYTSGVINVVNGSSCP